MIPVSNLYDEYIDRPKIDWTKKTHLSIQFLPPQEGSEQLSEVNQILPELGKGLEDNMVR